MSAFDVQEGGSHYRDMKIPLAEFCHANKIPKLEGDVIYYVVRFRKKNGIEDLKKARHTLDLLIELEEKAVAEKVIPPGQNPLAEAVKTFTPVSTVGFFLPTNSCTPAALLICGGCGRCGTEDPSIRYRNEIMRLLCDSCMDRHRLSVPLAGPDRQVIW